MAVLAGGSSRRVGAGGAVGGLHADRQRLRVARCPGAASAAPAAGSAQEDKSGVMDHLTIVIRPFRVEAVLAVIDAFGVDSCMLREAKGYGRQKGYLDRYRGEDFSEVYLPKVEVSVVVVAERSAELAEQLTKAARTGRIGDGKVLVVRSPYPPIEF